MAKLTDTEPPMFLAVMVMLVSCFAAVDGCRILFLRHDVKQLEKRVEKLEGEALEVKRW